MTTLPNKSLKDVWRDSYLSSGNEGYLEELYETYLTNPQHVTPEWRHYFDNLLHQVVREAAEVSHTVLREQFAQMARQPKGLAAATHVDPYYLKQQERVIELISAYRCLGHLQANIDPLGLRESMDSPMLELSYYGFTTRILKPHLISEHS